MDRPSYFSGVEVQRHDRRSVLIGRFAALALLSLLALPGFAARVPVRDGQSVNLKLRNILTTDNVRKGDVIEFEVTRRCSRQWARGDRQRSDGARQGCGREGRLQTPGEGCGSGFSVLDGSCR